MQKWFPQSGVEKPDWPAQSPNLDLIQHLWYKLEHQLWAKPYFQKLGGNLTNALVAEVE